MHHPWMLDRFLITLYTPNSKLRRHSICAYPDAKLARMASRNAGEDLMSSELKINAAVDLVVTYNKAFVCVCCAN